MASASANSPRLDAEHAQLDPDLGRLGLDRQRGEEVGLRLVGPTRRPERQAERQVGIRAVARAQRQHPLPRPDRRAEPPGPLVARGEVLPVVRDARLDRRGALERAEGLGESAQDDEHAPEVVVRLGTSRRQPRCLAIGRLRLVEPAQRLQCVAQDPPERRVPRRQSRGSSERLDRPGRIAPEPQRLAEVRMIRREAGCQRDGPAEVRLGLVEPAQLAEHDGQVVVDLRRSRSRHALPPPPGAPRPPPHVAPRSGGTARAPGRPPSTSPGGWLSWT